MKKLLILLIMLASGVAFGDSVIKENIGSGEINFYSLASGESATELVGIQNYSINPYLDCYFIGCWFWRDVDMVSGSTDRVDIFELGGGIKPHYSNNSMFTPYVDLELNYVFYTDIFASVFIGNLPDNGWVRRLTLGSEVDLSRIIELPLLFDFKIGQMTEISSDAPSVDMSELKFYYKLQSESYISLGRRVYSFDDSGDNTTTISLGFLSSF